MNNVASVNSVQSVESVVGKIKKLMALADGNQNEHEREVAMRFAMDLLAKHNLNIAEIQGSAIKIEIGEVKGDFRLEAWIVQVLSATCILYYTQFYRSRIWVDFFRRTTRDIPIFVGTADNIAVTIEVATWLINSIRLESNRAYKSAYERRSFRVGAADSLLMRAIDIVAAKKNAEKTTNIIAAARRALTGLQLTMYSDRWRC